MDLALWPSHCHQLDNGSHLRTGWCCITPPNLWFQTGAPIFHQGTGQASSWRLPINSPLGIIFHEDKYLSKSHECLGIRTPRWQLKVGRCASAPLQLQSACSREAFLISLPNILLQLLLLFLPLSKIPSHVPACKILISRFVWEYRSKTPSLMTFKVSFFPTQAVSKHCHQGSNTAAPQNIKDRIISEATVLLAITAVRIEICICDKD